MSGKKSESSENARKKKVKLADYQKKIQTIGRKFSDSGKRKEKNCDAGRTSNENSERQKTT